MTESAYDYNLVGFPPCPQKAITVAEGYRIMTDTHDGSHSWLKYVSRKEKLADQVIKDFVKENERIRKLNESYIEFSENPKWTKEQEKQFILARPPS